LSIDPRAGQWGPAHFFARFLDVSQYRNPSCAAIAWCARVKAVIDDLARIIRRLAVRRAAALSVIVIVAAAGPAAARPRSALPLLQVESPVEAYPAQRGGVSLAQATAIATSRFQGRVVRAETVNQGGRVVHEIRILGDDGRVRTVRVDAETGAVI